MATPYRQGFSEGLEPPPDVTVDEWADEYRVLSSKSSSEPGPWRTDRVPFMRRIMRAFSDSHPAESISLMKGAQVSGTESAIINPIGYSIHLSPSPVLVVQPTDPTVKKFSKQRIRPLLKETPEIADRISESRHKQSLYEVDFPGGFLILTGANSAANLRSMPIRRVLLDEIDEYKLDVDGQGDPCELAEARARTFANKKIGRISTPTFEATSRIKEYFLAGTQEYYFVPCVHCGVYQRILWKRNIRWTGDDWSTARFECKACGRASTDEHKTEMLRAGEWRAENPSAGPKHLSFHISSLYSPVGWLSWKEAAKQWIDAKGSQEKRRTFINTVLGETWEQKGEAPEWRRLYERREDYQPNIVPERAALLTCGVDVQKDRLEAQIVAWGPGLESWSIDYRVLEGDIYEPRVWNELSKLLTEKWPHEAGGELELARLAIDTGFATHQVYQWVRHQPPEKVMAVKGSDRARSLVGRRSTVDVKVDGRRISNGLGVWSVGVGIAKSQLYGWLRLDPDLEANDKSERYPPGYCHFPQYGPEFFKQLTAEERVVRKVRGFKRYAWELTRERNEALDTWVYARAAASAPPISVERFTEEHWEDIFEQIESRSAPRSERPTGPSSSDGGRRRRESNWL